MCGDGTLTLLLARKGHSAVEYCGNGVQQGMGRIVWECDGVERTMLTSKKLVFFSHPFLLRFMAERSAKYLQSLLKENQ